MLPFTFSLIIWLIIMHPIYYKKKMNQRNDCIWLFHWLINIINESYLTYYCYQMMTSTLKLLGVQKVTDRCFSHWISYSLSQYSYIFCSTLYLIYLQLLVKKYQCYVHLYFIIINLCLLYYDIKMKSYNSE